MTFKVYYDNGNIRVLEVKDEDMLIMYLTSADQISKYGGYYKYELVENDKDYYAIRF